MSWEVIGGIIGGLAAFITAIRGVHKSSISRIQNFYEKQQAANEKHEKEHERIEHGIEKKIDTMMNNYDRRITDLRDELIKTGNDLNTYKQTNNMEITHMNEKLDRILKILEKNDK